MAYNRMQESNVSLRQGPSSVARTGVDEPAPARATYLSRRGEPVHIQNRYTPEPDESRFSLLKCIKDFFISCIEAIAFLCCYCRRNEEARPIPLPDPVIVNSPELPATIPEQPGTTATPLSATATPPSTPSITLDPPSDAELSVDLQTQRQNLLRENADVGRVEQKLRRSGFSKFHLTDDIWHFDLDQRLNIYNTNFSYWTMLDPEFMNQIDNDFAEVVRFSGVMDVREMADALHLIRIKCPDTYQLNRYICSIIDYMKKKKAWVQDRQIVRFQQGWSGFVKIIESSEFDARTGDEKESEEAALRLELADILNNLVAASNDCVDQIGDTIEELLAEYACHNFRCEDPDDLAGYSRRWLGVKLFEWKRNIIEQKIDEFANTGRLNKDGGPPRAGSTVSAGRDRLLEEKVEVKRIILQRLSLPEERGRYGIVASALTTPRMADNFLQHMPAQLVPAVKKEITQENAIAYIINMMINPHFRGEVNGATSICRRWEQSITQDLQIEDVVYSSETNESVNILLNTFLAKVGNLHVDQLTPLGVLYILSKFGCMLID